MERQALSMAANHLQRAQYGVAGGAQMEVPRVGQPPSIPSVKFSPVEQGGQGGPVGGPAAGDMARPPEARGRGRASGEVRPQLDRRVPRLRVLEAFRIVQQGFEDDPAAGPSQMHLALVEGAPGSLRDLLRDPVVRHGVLEGGQRRLVVPVHQAVARGAGDGRSLRPRRLRQRRGALLVVAIFEKTQKTRARAREHMDAIRPGQRFSLRQAARLHAGMRVIGAGVTVGLLGRGQGAGEKRAALLVRETHGDRPVRAVSEGDVGIDFENMPTFPIVAGGHWLRQARDVKLPEGTGECGGRGPGRIETRVKHGGPVLSVVAPEKAREAPEGIRDSTQRPTPPDIAVARGGGAKLDLAPAVG